jgi:hypothetical protein
VPPGKLEGTATVTFQAIVPEESLVVEVSSSNYVSLELNFDENPSEVGWFLVADNDETFAASRCGSEVTGLVAFGPRQAYWEGLAYKQVMERIMLPAVTLDRQLTLIVYDTGRDGMCCNRSLALHTGESTIIVSDFTGERYTFIIDGESTPSSSPSSCAETPGTALMIMMATLGILIASMGAKLS